MEGRITLDREDWNGLELVVNDLLRKIPDVRTVTVEPTGSAPVGAIRFYQDSGGTSYIYVRFSDGWKIFEEA